MSKHKKDWDTFKDKHEKQEEVVREEDVEEAVQEDAALEHLSYTELEDRLTRAEQQAHENWEKSVRALAELENVRKRADNQVVEAERLSTSRLITAFLPTLDSLEQALQIAVKDSEKAMQEGLELTIKLFTDVLQKFGVSAIDPVGAVFDPQQHEAMSVQVAPGMPSNTVITVFQKGYKLNDRVIRPARVIVSKNES